MTQVTAVDLLDEPGINTAVLYSFVAGGKSIMNVLLYFVWAHQRHRQCCICHTAPEGSTFVPCDTAFYAPTHTTSYLWHGRECCTQNTALGTGSQEQYSTRFRLVLYCSPDPAPCAVICIQHSLLL